MNNYSEQDEYPEITIEFNKKTKSLVYCPVCNKVLYEMPVDKRNIGGIYLRVANNLINSHSESLVDHNPGIYLISKDKCDLYLWEANPYILIMKGRDKASVSRFFVSNM